MIDYQEVKDVLENSINEIKKSLGSLGDSCKEIENYYNQNYLNYKDNIFRSIKDEEFQIGPNSFEKIFTESVDFLKSQLNFAEQLLSLDYVQNESRLSKYTNKIFENCINVIKVSAKYSCGFPDPQVLPIIVVDRYLDYFTTIMEDRLWQVLAKPVFRWRNRSGLSMNADRAA